MSSVLQSYLMYFSVQARNIPPSRKKKILYFMKLSFLALIFKKFIYFLKRKFFLYFRKWNFLTLTLKNLWYFWKWNPALSSQSPKIKKIHSRKISYTSGNGKPQKSFYSFSKLETLKNLFIFQEVTFQALQMKRTHSENVSYISGNGTSLPQGYKLLTFQKGNLISQA